MSHGIENPFTPSAIIIKGNRFIGRKEGISEIEHKVLVSHPNNLAIIGEPRIGKSSLVYQATIERRRALQEKKFLPIWINLGTCQSAHEFFYKLPKQCMKELEQWAYPLDSGISNAAALCRQEEKSGQVDFESIKYFFEKVRQADIQVLLILDEFDDARRIFKEDGSGFQCLRELSYNPDCQVTYITTSRRTIYQIELQTGVSSTLDGIFSKYYLCPFETDDLQDYFSRLDATGIPVTPALKEDILFYTGGHPHLLNILSYEIVEIFHKQKTVDVKGAYSKTATSFTHYYKYLQKLLDEDNSLNKLLQILCGPVVDIETTDVEGFLAHGLIKEGPGDAYSAFSPHFQAYLRLISRKFDLWPTLSQTERALRTTIEKVLRGIYHDQWIDELKKNYRSLKSLFERCEKQQQKDFDFWGQKSSNILDNTYITDLFEIISLEWHNANFGAIFKIDRADWEKRTDFLRNVRNALAHNKDKEVINDIQRQQAEVYFKEILAAIQ